MVICVLALYPATRLDWLVLARLGVATMANIPGNPDGISGGRMRMADVALVHTFTPAVLLACAVGVVVLAVTGQWGVSENASEYRSVVVRLPFVTATEMEHLALTQTPDGFQIDGFIAGQTQARIAFTRRGEQAEIVCVTEELACAQLAVLAELRGWQLVSAVLEPLTYSGS
jgi:hypothetical protein